MAEVAVTGQGARCRGGAARSSRKEGSDDDENREAGAGPPGPRRGSPQPARVSPGRGSPPHTAERATVLYPDDARVQRPGAARPGIRIDLPGHARSEERRVGK